MKDARTGIDPTLILATRMQMWGQGIRIKIGVTLVGAMVGFLLMFSVKPPQPIDMSSLKTGLQLRLIDAVKLEAASRLRWTWFYPQHAHLVAALPDNYKQAGLNYLAQARKVYWAQWKKYLYNSAGGAILFFVLITLLSRKEQQLREEDRHVRGAEMVPNRHLNKDIKRTSPGRLNLAGVAVPATHEITPWIFAGRPRQGKTVAIKSVLDQISGIGLKIVFDSKGDFVATHSKSNDLIFAPSVDRRSLKWTLFNDVTSLSQIAAIAAALIPEVKGNGAMFATGARQILEGLLLHCFHAGKRTNAHLWQVCTLPPAEMKKLLQETPGGEQGAALLDKPDTPTAFSFYVNLSSYLKPIQLLAKCDGDFSIRRWLASADQGNTQSLFILSNPDHQEALKPVLNLFLNTLITAHLSMSDNLERRVWYLLDELAILPKIPKLMDALNFGPSKGLSALLGFQAYQQLDEIYGRETREAVVSASGTHAIFSLGSKAAADVAVDIVGREEVIESRGTLSTGITDGRHGGSTMEQTRNKELITADGIKDLKSLNAVVKFLGFPATMLKFEYQAYPKNTLALDPDPGFDLETYLLELGQLHAQAVAAGGVPPEQVAVDTAAVSEGQQEQSRDATELAF